MRNELNSLKIYELGFSLRLSHTHVACNNMHGQRGRNRKLKVGQQISGGETIKVHSRSRLDQRSFLSSPKPFFKLPRKLSNRAQWLGYFVHSRRKLITYHILLCTVCKKTVVHIANSDLGRSQMKDLAILHSYGYSRIL